MKTKIDYRIAKISEELQLKNLLVINNQKPTISLELNHNIYYLAQLKSEVIGMVGAELEGSFGLLRSAAVLKNWRNNSIAFNLILLLINDLHERDIRCIYLFSKDKGEYWKKFGFKQCDVKEIANNLPNTLQVRSYIEDNSIWTDIAWKVSIDKIMSNLDNLKVFKWVNF